MGQKINTFGMRLKNRLNWNYTFCVHKNTKFNEVFFNSHQLDFVNKLIFSNLAYIDLAIVDTVSPVESDIK